MGTYTVPAEVTVVGHDVGVSGGTYQVRVTISEQTSDQPAEPIRPPERPQIQETRQHDADRNS